MPTLLMYAYGFRLHGFVFRYERKEQRTAVSFGNVSGGAIEDCVFDRTGPPSEKADPIQEYDLGIHWWKGFLGVREIHVRRCAFGATLGCADDRIAEAVPLVVEQCLFRPERKLSGITYGSQHVAVIRHNVIETMHGDGIIIQDAPQRKVLQISNNFIHSRLNGIQCLAGSNNTTIVNNVLAPAFRLIGERPSLDMAKAWSLGHNAFRRAMVVGLELPRQSSDILLNPDSAFFDTLDPGYARIPSDSPLAKGGAGGAWPSYIGALPPGPAPKDGDWFTRLRKKWLKDKPAINKKL